MEVIIDISIDCILSGLILEFFGLLFENKVLLKRGFILGIVSAILLILNILIYLYN